MNRDELRALQQPLKEQYKTDPNAAFITLRAKGALGDDVTGFAACSGDKLLQALVACAGVTLSAVATSIGIKLRGATLSAEGDLDFRGTLGVAKGIPVGFRRIRLSIELDTDASDAEKNKLIELTERYCVVYQTLVHSPDVVVALRQASAA